MNSGPVVITDAGPLIALAKLGRLDLLAALYTDFQAPEAVYREAVLNGLVRRAPEALNIQIAFRLYNWSIIPTPDRLYVSISEHVLLGDGEIQVLNAASLRPSALVLIDDEIARNEARRIGLTVKGTLGVLVQAYRTGLLSRQEIEALLQTITMRRDIWIKAELCERILAQLP